MYHEYAYMRKVRIQLQQGQPVQESYLVKDLQRAEQDLDLQKLGGDVLHPVVYDAGLQQPQAQGAENDYEYAQQVKELAAVQRLSALLTASTKFLHDCLQASTGQYRHDGLHHY